MKQAWWKESVVYQVYPRSFQDSNGDGIGDLAGVTSRLDYLRELGVDVIWLSPFYRSPGGDNGYDISDYQAIEPCFGTMEDFDRMLAEAHARGIRVVVDLVVNHTSEMHPWFIESRSSRDNPKRDFYIWRDGKNGGPPNNWGSKFSGSAWTLDETTGQYYLHTFGTFQPDLNWDNPAVREEVFKMMRWWCDKGVDGFRMDTISMISKTPEMPDGELRPGSDFGDFGPYVYNGPNVHKYLREMREKVLRHYDLLTVGECSGLTVQEACQYANDDGTELNMAFHFEHMDLDGSESFKWNRNRIDLVELKALLTKWQKELDGKAWNSLYWCNHDQPRIVSRLGNDSTPELREKSAKAIALTIHMMQGTPYVYEGEELAMTNAPFGGLEDFRDIESINAYNELVGSGRMGSEEMLGFLRYKSRDNSRTPMQWDAGKNAGFSEGEPWIMVNPNYKEINAAEQLSRPDSVFRFYQELIRLRHTHKLIVYGSYDLILPEDRQLFAYTRTLGDQRLLCVVNLSDEPAACEVPEEFAAAQKLIEVGQPSISGGRAELAPWDAFVLAIL